MSTLLDILTDALFEIKAIGVGESLSPEDADIGLRYANRLIGSWNAERLCVYHKRFDQIPVVAAGAKFSVGSSPVTATVTPASPTVLSVPNEVQIGQSVTISGATGAWIGLNATFVVSARTSGSITVPFNSTALASPITGIPLALFNLPRPVSIESANFINSTGESFDLDLLTSQRWSKKPSKATTDRISTELYFDFAYPLATAYPWPITTQSGCKIEFWTWQQLLKFAAIGDTFDFPPGYEVAIMMNLAVDLSAAFPGVLSQSTIARAQQYKNSLQGINAPPIPGAMQEALVSQPPPRGDKG